VRILVYPHVMELGGSQLNAIELAAATRDLGHEVSVVAEDGPLVSTVERLGLERIPLAAGVRRRRPSPLVSRQLVELARHRHLDVVHGYEWPPGVEAWFGPRLRLGTAVVCTVMSMSVAPFLPRALPLVVGTADLAERARADGFRSVQLIEPPVDTDANHPGVEPGDFRARYDLDPGVPLAVAVCRLVPELKLEGLLAATSAVAELNAAGQPCQLAIVGDGPCRGLLEQAAGEANQIGGRTVLTGALADPRTAYAAADVMLGMGGSALRGMAFGKPLIVQGEHGYWKLLTPDSAPEFLASGWYGIGSGVDGVPVLAGILRGLLPDAGTRAKLGGYARELVVDRFSLRHAARTQEEFYQAALAGGQLPAGDLARSAAGVFAYKLGRKVARLRGTARTDDFNAVGAATPK
jgi:glycosyltransferase involved in cell wall biosynthesis